MKPFFEMTERRKIQTGAILLLILSSAFFCNGRPFPRVDEPSAASSVTLSATTTVLPPTTSSINQYWSIIVLFGTFGFMLFAGFLIWLVGKIYAAFYGYPQPEPVHTATRPEHGSSCDCRRCTERREREAERRLIRNYEARCEELGRLYREIGDEERYRELQRFLQDRDSFNFPEIPTIHPSCSHAIDDVHIDVTEVESHIQQSKFDFRRSFRSWFPPREERVGRHEQLFRKAASRRACEPLYQVENDSQDITLPRKESPPVRLNIFSSSLWMNLYYLTQLPFFGVSNLVYELLREPEVVRRYYMSLLPFSGEICWEEVQMASWEFSRVLFSALPFCNVSDEVLRECTSSSTPKISREERRRRRNSAMLDDVEANASIPEEQYSALEKTTDFVQYMDETEQKVKITRLD